jgi:hypothetical protein
MRPSFLVVCLSLITASGPSGPAAPRLEKSNLEAEELADFLGIDAWTFRYSGGRVRCWLEIQEGGRTAVEPVDGVQDPNRGNADAEQGKILLWIRRGEIRLRVHSGASKGGYFKSLAEDALWWGWKSSSGQEHILPVRAGEKGVQVKPGEEVTLLRLMRQEVRDRAHESASARKVTILLKAIFPVGD